MKLYAFAHEDGPKDLNPVIKTQIPANQGGLVDLRIALEGLFNHQNRPPFISRRLIQRLLTSNPSPAYVYRVAQTFVDDSTSTRGNLGAVVHAILTDYEARSPVVAANPSFANSRSRCYG